MVTETSSNSLAITDLLVRHHPAIAETIIQACKSRNIELHIIKGTNDYWCRDFMPLQVNRQKFVQFVYDPSYYKHVKYMHLKSDINELSFYPSGTIVNSKIVLDGGNISYYQDKAVITDKIFKDNVDLNKHAIIDELTELLELDEIVIIPKLPYDITGHSDGMVKFINSDSLIINDFRLIGSESYWIKLSKALKKFNLMLIPNDLHHNKIRDDATGDYINVVIIKDLVFIPSYGSATDHLAHQLIQTVFPGHTLISIPSNELSFKGGILHCATWNLLN